MTAYGFGRMRIQPSGSGQVVCGECRLHMEVKRLAPEEEAVIEAALAWHDSGEHVCGVALADAIDRMLRAHRQYPPKPGDLLAEVAQDDRLRRMYAAKLKAETAARFIRTKARAAALTRSVKASEDADLQRLRDRVSSRQEGVQGGPRRIEPEMTEAEAKAQRDRDVARFLAEMEG